MLSRSRISDVDDVDPYDDDRSKYEATASWLIFASVMAIVTESFIISLRFLNIAFINANFPLVGVVVSFTVTVKGHDMSCRLLNLTG